MISIELQFQFFSATDVTKNLAFFPDQQYPSIVLTPLDSGGLLSNQQRLATIDFPYMHYPAFGSSPACRSQLKAQQVNNQASGRFRDQ
jgi:hypothetical protein